MTGWADRLRGRSRAPDRRHAQGDEPDHVQSSSISQWAAVEALDGPQDFIAPNANCSNPARSGGLDAEPSGRLALPHPQGAFYVYPSCEGAIGKQAPSGRRISGDADFASELLVYRGGVGGPRGRLRTLTLLQGQLRDLRHPPGGSLPSHPAVLRLPALKSGAIVGGRTTASSASAPWPWRG